MRDGFVGSVKSTAHEVSSLNNKLHPKNLLVEFSILFLTAYFSMRIYGLR